MKMISACLLLAILCSCSSVKPPQATSTQAAQPDPYLWLEDVHSQKAIDWVKPHNEKTWNALSQNHQYKQFAQEIRKIVTSKDRIPYPTIRNGIYRNFWQDQEHVRGILRETSADDYTKKEPDWKTILDIDALNKKEGKSWVFAGAHSMPPDYNFTLISLSEGGSDREVMREFDWATRTFVKNGFELPAGKHRVSWVDKDTILVGTDFGPGTLTTSGYPRQVKLWKRGTPLSSAKLIFEGKPEDVSVEGFKSFRPESNYIFLSRGIGFFEEENSVYTEDGKIQKLPFPTTAEFVGDFRGFFLAKLRQDWQTSKRLYRAGSLISLPASEISHSNFQDALELVYEPDSRSTLNGVEASKSFVFLNTLKNVRGQILMASHDGADWQLKPVPLPDTGLTSINDADPFTDTILVSYQDFTTPPSLYKLDCTEPNLKPELLKRLPRQYNSKGIVAEQKQAISADGTKIPYFLIHKKSMKLDDKNPTLLYAYGGFESSQTPYYLGSLGKVWLERGGVYAIANIRGGGEFGPKWHEAALKENRQRAYDDFIAVSEDLIHQKITSPRNLGIRGGSNGGLLVGAAFTQRPDLYHAVLCESALLDMLRYTKLPPGASWIAEYGDPEDPKLAEVIRKYSPYQNLRPSVKYPKVFFYSSTGDDRVQPGHTRKMVAKMEALGNDVYLYENIEGGHGAAADLEQGIKKSALEYSYLFKQLAEKR